ncbi:MAG: aminopeptidase [SAR324 cluster bacterium]|uniref:Aminopeptidase n=1 Tax=SAR324 cluster bacterium TaxID=2024889 RepID=A0A7X9FQX1_9DELT|nr:aminopeptidase [SAR324 cluster bacterium]
MDPGRLHIFCPRMLFVCLLSFSIIACSPGYVLRAAVEEGRILAGREKIEDLLRAKSTPEEIREKLQLVLSARNYAEDLGLNMGDSFTRYYQLDRDVFAWVLMASKKDSFTLVHWWYPIVGSFPYKGYFSKESAEELAKELELEGYETWLRGTDAISTLGWFNDPVMSTTLSREPVSIVNTVFHESFHSTVWIKNHTAFNESAANFFGYATSPIFFERQKALCTSDLCLAAVEKQLQESLYVFQRELVIGDILSSLYDKLDKLYSSSKAKESVLEERVQIFKEETEALHNLYPNIKVLQSVNNAELMQLKLYLSKLRDFEQLFNKNGRDPSRFIAIIRDIQVKSEKDSTLDPFSLLEEKLK